MKSISGYEINSLLSNSTKILMGIFVFVYKTRGIHERDVKLKVYYYEAQYKCASTN